MKHIGCLLAEELHPFGMDCHNVDYIRNSCGYGQDESPRKGADAGGGARNSRVDFESG
jgi:hypothetical protein